MAEQPSAPPPAPVNPYVGPRAFLEAERLYGRGRESRELFNLLVPERIVLLHSPSGAGKTSLIQAALIPKLKDESFVVRHLVRINTEHPPDILREIGRHNRYVLSTLLSLEEDLPAERRSELKELATLTIAEYLSRTQPGETVGDEGAPLSAEELSKLPSKEVIKYLARRKKASGVRDAEVLIFDQFEEVLTLDPTDVAQKKEFFRQLGEALRDRQRWALFSMREDYVAPLDPYLDELPTRLATNYRLDLLDIDAARRAIKRPAEGSAVVGPDGREHKVYFSDNAVTELVQDLRRVYVQRMDGSVERTEGPHVEPVHLQVVCHRLWDKVARNFRGLSEAHDMVIRKDDVQSGGEVNKALADYYAEKVADTAAEEAEEAAGRKAKERAIRDWFEKNLITEQGLRGQVLQSTHASHGLYNHIIRKLVNHYLVREERRRGAVWFELAHDRLIEPVRLNNAAWREANLTTFQRKAEAWKKSDHASNLIMDEKELQEAEEWVAAHPGELTPDEEDYLAASQSLRNEKLKERKALREQRRRRAQKARFRKRLKQAQRNRRVIVTLSFVTAAALVATLLAVVFYFKAGRRLKLTELAADTAVSRKLSSYSVSTGRSNPELRILLALEAVTQIYPKHRDVINSVSDICKPHDPHEAEQEAAGDHSAAAQTSPQEKEDESTRIKCEARASLLQARDILKQLLLTSQVKYTVQVGDVKALAYTPDGNKVVTAAGADPTLTRYTTVGGVSHGADASRPVAIADTSNKKSPSSFAFDPKGRVFLIGFSDGTVATVSLDAPDAPPRLPLKVHEQAVKYLSYDPSGQYVLTADEGGAAKVWEAQRLTQDTPGDLKPIRAFQLGPEPRGLALSAGGEFLAALGQEAGRDAVGLWSVRDGRELSNPARRAHGLLSGQQETSAQVNALAFGVGSDGQPLLASGDEDGSVSFLNMKTWKVGRSLSHGSPVYALTFSRDGKFLATAGNDRAVKLWDMSGSPPQQISTLRGQGLVSLMSFSPDDSQFVSWGQDLMLRMWNIKGDFGPVEEVAFTGDGNGLLSLTGRGKILVGDTEADRRRLFFTYTDKAQPAGVDGSLVVSPDGKSMFVADGKNITLWLITAQSSTLDSTINAGMNIRSLALSPGEPHIAAVGGDDPDTTEVGIWNFLTGDRVKLPPGVLPAKGEIRSLAFGSAEGPGSGRLALADRHGFISVWDHRGDGGDGEYTQRCAGLRQNVPEAKLNDYTVNKMVFSPDGQFVAGADSVGKVSFWEVSTCSLKSETKVQNSPISDIKFDPRGQLFALAGRDVKVIKWLTGANVFLFDEEETDGVRSIAFSPDGKNLVSVTQRGERHVHFLGDTEELMVQARRQIPFTWKEDECSFYLQESAEECRAKADSLGRLVEANGFARGNGFVTDQTAPLPNKSRDKNDGWRPDNDASASADATPSTDPCDQNVSDQSMSSSGVNKAIAIFKWAKADGDPSGSFLNNLFEWALGRDDKTPDKGFAYDSLKYSAAGGKLCPREEALALAEEGNAEAARNFANADEWDRAATFYLWLDNRDELMRAANILVRNGKVAEAIAAHDKARQRPQGGGGELSNAALAKSDNELCWFGSWWGNATERLMSVCREAVSLNDDPNRIVLFNDSLGVAMARLWQANGDDAARQQAIQLFEQMRQSSAATPPEKAERARWVAALKDGKCIFELDTIMEQLGMASPPGANGQHDMREEFRQKFARMRGVQCPADSAGGLAPADARPAPAATRE